MGDAGLAEAEARLASLELAVPLLEDERVGAALELCDDAAEHACCLSYALEVFQPAAFGEDDDAALGEVPTCRARAELGTGAPRG